MSSPFYCCRKVSLVACANTGLPPRFYLKPIRDISSQPINIFIVYRTDFIYTKTTRTPPRNEPPPWSPHTHRSGIFPPHLSCHKWTNTSANLVRMAGPRLQVQKVQLKQYQLKQCQSLIPMAVDLYHLGNVHHLR